jgi:tetratricopeptide (TPR) repeat protein
MSFPPNAPVISSLIIGSLLLTIPGSFRAQTPGKTSQTSQQSSGPAQQKPDYSQEAVVVEQLSSAYRFESDGTGQRELSLRVKVQSDAGVDRFGQVIVGYSSASEKLDMDFVRVRKADGTTVNASTSDIQDLAAPVTREAPVYTDLRQKHITVPGLRPGDVLEYHMVWTMHTPLAPNHFWLEHAFVTTGAIVLKDELSVNIPAGSKIKLKTGPGFEPTIKEEKDRRLYHWEHANLKPDSEKKKNKEEEEETEKVEPEELRPQVQLTTFQSWEEVGQWYADLQRDRIVPDEKIKEKVKELISGRTTDKEKVRAIYDFVARNFRYVSLSLGQGRYQPHTAASVITNQYGDCKDKHTLLASMLAATGLQAYPVLINSARKLDLDVPSPGQFDHVISAIPLGNEILWADTTPEVAPVGLLDPSLRNKKALMIPATGPARLESTPSELPFIASEVVTIEGTVDELGKLNAHTHMVLRGDSEMLMRVAFHRTARSEWKVIGDYLSLIKGMPGEVSDIKTTDPADTEKPFEVEFNVSRKDFLDWSSRKLKVALPFPTFDLSSLTGRKTGSTKPIELGPPTNFSYTLKLTLPSKYKVRLPLPLKVSRDYGEYVSNYKLEGQSLVGERTLKLRQRELASPRLQDYNAFTAAVRSDATQTLSLETEVAGTPAIPESVKSDDLIQAAEAATKNGKYATAEEILKRVLEKDPKHQTVRRYLGWVLAGQHKYDEAVRVLQEQIKINPFEDFAYNLLGNIYRRQQDYANAEAAFRKQIEVAPLDESAHANLGRMLVESRKYKEAIPELERAISLTPDAEDLHVNLGRAYLNLGETQKSMSAFEEAIKTNRSPGVLNDIAYFLADKGVQLDRALQYAESSVSSIAINLRNLETSDFTTDDLGNVASFAASWDTLGWVYFKRGDLDSAEKYIKAAWILQQHGDVCYHLGAIAEKRGRKDEAIRLYAQGAAALDTSSEARESLLKLVTPASLEALLQTARQDLRQNTVFNLGQLVPNLKAPVEAEFYLIYAPDSARNAQAIDVRFIKGAESLKPLAAQLKAMKYPLVFPDNLPTKVIRRGALLCLPKPGPCTFTMVSPDLIRSVD